MKWRSRFILSGKAFCNAVKLWHWLLSHDLTNQCKQNMSAPQYSHSKASRLSSANQELSWSPFLALGPNGLEAMYVTLPQSSTTSCIMPIHLYLMRLGCINKQNGLRPAVHRSSPHHTSYQCVTGTQMSTISRIFLRCSWEMYKVEWFSCVMLDGIYQSVMKYEYHGVRHMGIFFLDISMGLGKWQEYVTSTCDIVIVDLILHHFLNMSSMMRIATWVCGIISVTR